MVSLFAFDEDYMKCNISTPTISICKRAQELSARLELLSIA